MAPDMSDEAREGVLYLEAMCGERLDEVPVARRDQWTSGVRETFGNMGVDLNSTQEAQAAFIGARMAVATLMSDNPRSGVATVHLLRYLMDKADGAKEPNRRRRFRVWLSEKLMPR